MPAFAQKRVRVLKNLNMHENQNNPKIRTEFIHAKPQRYRNEPTIDTGIHSWKINGNLNGKKQKY